MPTNPTSNKKHEDKVVKPKDDTDSFDDLSKMGETEIKNMASESMAFWGIMGFVVLLVVVAIVVIINASRPKEEAPVPAPIITILNSDAVDVGDNTYELTINNKYTGIRMDFGGTDGTCKKENGFSATINGKDITSSVGDYCSTYEIENKDVQSGGFTYTIVAKNKSGEDQIKVKVEKIEEKATSKYPITSSGMDLPTAAHVNCRSYANRYFYPDKVELNNILDGGDYDYQVDDGWLWKPIAWVTSSAGGKIAYQAVCKTDLDGHVTSFYTWE